MMIKKKDTKNENIVIFYTTHTHTQEHEQIIGCKHSEPFLFTFFLYFFGCNCEIDDFLLPAFRFFGNFLFVFYYFFYVKSFRSCVDKDLFLLYVHLPSLIKRNMKMAGSSKRKKKKKKYGAEKVK